MIIINNISSCLVISHLNCFKSDKVRGYYENNKFILHLHPVVSKNWCLNHRGLTVDHSILHFMVQ